MLLQAYQPRSELCLPAHPTPLPKRPVIDVHTHMGAFWAEHSAEALREFIGHLRGYGLVHAVNLDLLLGKNDRDIWNKQAELGDFFLHFGVLDLDRFRQPDFERYAAREIERMAKDGARGLKFHKTLGLHYRDERGELFRLDHPRLQCVWQTAAALHLPVLFHNADPTAFFRPVDGHNERYEELGAHPDWWFGGAGMPSFAQLMEAQETMLAQNPQTTFIAAHVGGYSENLARVGEWLDRFPNLHVDIAERISELGRQPYTAAAFFRRYAGRILFGTDMFPNWAGRYPIYYRFLETMDEHFAYDDFSPPRQGRWAIYGIGLEDEVLEQVYYQNAARLLRL